jgi:hypothetical protein
LISFKFILLNLAETSGDAKVEMSRTKNTATLLEYLTHSRVSQRFFYVFFFKSENFTSSKLTGLNGGRPGAKRNHFYNDGFAGALQSKKETCAQGNAPVQARLRRQPLGELHLPVQHPIQLQRPVTARRRNHVSTITRKNGAKRYF